MKKIWKFPIPIKDECEIQVPFLSENNIHFLSFHDQFLCVKEQDSMLTIWAMVDPNAETRSVIIQVVGTGVPCDYVRTRDYLGTVLINGFVWHLFST